MIKNELVGIEQAAPSEAAMAEARRKVFAIEDRFKALPAEMQIDIPAEHFFCGGVYARKIVIPQGAAVTGKIHKYWNMNFVHGDIVVLVDDGVARLTGFNVVCSPPGIKRIARALEETVWVTVLPTKEEDPDLIERLFTASTEAEYQQFLMLARAEMAKCLS